MRRLTLTDALGEIVTALSFSDDYPLDRLADIARREATALTRHGGRAAWTITEDDGHEIDGGTVSTDAPAGLLAARTPVVYCEDDLDLPLSAFGTVRAVIGGHYIVAVDHVDSGGRTVPIGAATEIRVPVDTPAIGALRTLTPLPTADAVAAA